LLGEHSPPVIRYRLDEEDAGFFAEFLTVKKGDGLKRDGKPDLTVSKAGITAQKLRHIELLFEVPWKVQIGPQSKVPIERTVDLAVPNPVSFIVQKLLINKHRDGDKKAQDVLYIHDTLELFGGSLDELQSIWECGIKPTLPVKTARRAIATASELFEEVTDDSNCCSGASRPQPSAREPPSRS
jgi:hypothetical protein